ncbi:helix-turn-helix domain-containing protein [Georgenia sp. MJ170]|uniref:helix-turn-helix domain-containing protein n=1 Tax=Georgenia sunbinii TaxID=3117728 RepID=UPI002F263278
MSLEAMVWALKRAPIPNNDPLAQLVLIGLADHAADDGTGARPSVATLAQYARCSARSVHNKLRLLEDAGVIVRDDQRAVEHLPANRRPVVYGLALAGVHDVQRSTAGRPGVNSATGRGERPGSGGVHAGADRTVLEPSVEPSLNLSTSIAAQSTTAEALFEEFWQCYPRRVGKKAARKAWDKAHADGADLHAVIAGAVRLSTDHNREDAFTPHPSTWLNQGRWEDDPLPARSLGGYGARQDAVLMRERERARQLDGGNVLAIGGAL